MAPLIDSTSPSTSRLLQKPLNTMPHGGGQHVHAPAGELAIGILLRQATGEPGADGDVTADDARGLQVGAHLDTAFLRARRQHDHDSGLPGAPHGGRRCVAHPAVAGFERSLPWRHGGRSRLMIGCGMPIENSRHWDPDEVYLFPPSPREWLPENHLAHLVLEVVAELDLSAVGIMRTRLPSLDHDRSFREPNSVPDVNPVVSAKTV